MVNYLLNFSSHLTIFIKKNMKKDPKARKIRYKFCYHFLPRLIRIGKIIWKGSHILHHRLCMKRLLHHQMKQPMTLWFNKNWLPKKKEQSSVRKVGVTIWRKKQSLKGEQRWVVVRGTRTECWSAVSNCIPLLQI